MSAKRAAIAALPFALAAAALGSAIATGCRKGGGSVAFVSSSLFTPSPVVLDPGQELPGVVLTIVEVKGGSGPSFTFRPGDGISVRFKVTRNDGTPLPLADLDGAEILLSGPSFNYQRVLPDQDDMDMHALADVRSSSVTNLDGTHTYRFPKPIPSTYPPPFHDTTKFKDGELTGKPLLAGTYTIGLAAWKSYYVEGVLHRDVGNAVQDVRFLGAQAIEPREVVRTDNCNRCHTRLERHEKFRDTRMCVLCHTSGAEDEGSTDTADATNVTVDFRVLIHKIHSGAHLPSVLGVGTRSDGSRDYAAPKVPYVVGTQDFSEVSFPVWPSLSIAMPKGRGYSALAAAEKTADDAIRTGVVACGKCHEDPDGAGPLPAPARGDLAYLQPSRRACGACHDDIDWAKSYVRNTTVGMPPQTTDSSCVQCHRQSGIDPDSGALGVRDAHLHPHLDPAIDPGLVLTITKLTGGTGSGGNFQAGDTPTIELSVADGAGRSVPLSDLDSTSAIVVGPTTNRQAAFAYASPNGVAATPYDSTGRLAAASTTGKGSMSRVAGPTITETLTVTFSSATAFTVSGSLTGAVGASALPATPSTNPSGSSLSGIAVVASAVLQTITVEFKDSQTFDVTGSVSGFMGTAKLPAQTSASIRFAASDRQIAFNVSAGTTPAASGNAFYLTVFRGSSSSATFAIVAGRTSFAATDRFYYEVVAPAPTYTLVVPMDIPLELLGTGNGTVGQQLTPANQPVAFGRQTLLASTASVGVIASLSAPSAAYGRFADLNVLPATLAVNDYAAIDSGTATVEVAQVGFIETTGGLKRVWFRNPLRYAHAANAPLQENTLAFRQEGVHYALFGGTITLLSPSRGFQVLSYRTDGRFGWFRARGDSLQAVYPPPINDSPDIGETWGEWTGKSFESGTYTVAIWGYANRDLVRNGELQTYRGTSHAATQDFLFGSATKIAPYAFVPKSGETCYVCHDDLRFHGGGRRGFETCITCHGTAGSEDWPRYSTRASGPPSSTKGVTVNFRTMLHKIHRGKDLAKAETYAVEGFGGPSTFDEIVFPPIADATKQCTKCHGEGSTAWKEPSDRSHSTQQGLPLRAWEAVCTSCHDSTSVSGHVGLMTAGGTTESCAVCHGPGAEHSVEKRHKTR